MGIRIMAIIITVTLILPSLSIITVIPIIMGTIMVDTGDQGVAMKSTGRKVTRKESWLH